MNTLLNGLMRLAMSVSSRLRRSAASAARTLFPALVWLAVVPAVFAASAPAVPLADVPLVISKSAQPQVLFLVTNSESMDGTTGGAIMTGAQGCYTPTGGFIPPYGLSGGYKSGYTPTAACPSGQAAYTVKDSGGTQYDNSESRLNVAKAGLQQILTDYQGAMEFGLMDYSVQSPHADPYQTWVYYMSESGGFTFTDTAASDTYPNPCYGSSSGACSSLASNFPGATTDKYLVAALSSDSPTVNDVLYAGGLPSVFVTYNGLYNNSGQRLSSTEGPYYSSTNPHGYKLGDYEAGSVLVRYKSSYVYGYGFATGPTNAGYVPYSDQVLYAARGFGYNSTNALGSGGSAGNLVEKVDVYSASHYAALDTALAPETNVGATAEIKSAAVQSPIGGMLKSAYNYYTGSSAPPSSNSCTPDRYVVLVTDGLPTEDLDGNAWPPLGSAAAAGYGVTATFNADGTVASTNDQALTDTINQLKALYAAHVHTYIIGLGAGVDPTVNPMAAKVLTAMALAGSGGKSSTFFAANNAATLSGDLHRIVGLIEAAALSTSSAAVNSTTVRTNSVAFQARFTPSTSPYSDWTGDLLAFPIAADGTVNTTPSAATWSAQALLDTKNWNTGRVIATWNPAAASGAGAGAPFRWADLSAAQQADLQTSSSDTLGPARLDYLRGDTSQEQRNGGTFRNRSHILGDIVDSAPLWVGPPSAPYPDASYQTFKTAEASRPAVVYVGANDGMLHAFDAASGFERFAFVPNGVYPDLMALTSPSYNLNHLFYVDGSPTAGDVEFSDGSWHTILVGGLNHGGKSVYALDITNPSSDGTESGLASNVLWEFSSPYLGYSYGQPQIARIPWGSSGGTKFVVIFGSGYNNTDQNPYLFVVDPQTGQLIKQIDLCAGQPASVCNPSRSNGTVGAAMVYPGTDGTATAAYAGDLQGNLWKVDFSSGNKSTWKVTLLFQATDSSGTPQPITTEPVVSLHPLYPGKPGYMVYFGTGRLLGQADLTTTQTQTFYGIWDNGVTYPVPKSKLVQQTITDVPLTSPPPGGPTSVRTLTANPINWNSDLGWYMNLPDTGERLITDPLLESGRVLFTSFVPNSDPCKGGGTSWLMVVDYANGGALTRPEIDLNGDDRLNSADLVSGQVPAGISLGPGLASAPTLMGYKKGDVGDVKLISESSGSIQSVKERGGAAQSGRWSWWEVQ